MQVSDSHAAMGMRCLEQTATRLRAIIDARVQRRVPFQPVDPAVEDADLLSRCRAAAPAPAALWRAKIEQIMSDLCTASDTAVGESGDNDKVHDDERSRNSPRTCVLNLLAVLGALSIEIYDIRTIPKGLDAIPCVEDDTFISADCGLGRWRFVVSLSRDPDCIGGIVLIERIVDNLTGASIDAVCDLRCQNTSASTCALLVDFMRSGETSVSAFLDERFAWSNEIVDRLDAPGWTIANHRFIGTDSLDCPIEPDALLCTSPAGETLSLIVYRDAVLAYSQRTPWAKYSFARPLALPRECVTDGTHASLGDGFRATGWGDREWLIDAGYASPWLSTDDSDMRRAPVAVLGIRGHVPIDTTELMVRIDTVAAIASGAYGISAAGCEQGLDNVDCQNESNHISAHGRGCKAASECGSKARGASSEADYETPGPGHLSGDASGSSDDSYGGATLEDNDDLSDGAYHPDPKWRNGNHCGQALNARLLSQNAPWSDLGSFSTLLTVGAAIDPSRGLLVNWLISCDMLPVADGPFGHAVRARGLPFVRCRAHLVVAPPDVESRSAVLVHAHVMATLHRADARESGIYVRDSFGEPGPDETTDVDALLADLNGETNAPNMHPILGYYRQMQIKGVCGGQSLIYVRPALDNAAAVLYETVQPPRLATADAFDSAMAWLLDEFGRCAALFTTPPQ